MSILPPVPNCSKAVRFFLLFLPKIKQRLKIFPDFHTEGETSAWRLANGGRAVERSYYLEKSASASVFYKSCGITFLLSRGGERWYQLNGKSFAFSEPARGLPRAREKEENCSSRGVDVV